MFVIGNFPKMYAAWRTNLTNCCDETRSTRPSALRGWDVFWSARVGLHYRALAVERENVMVGFWVGTHAAYKRLVGDR